MPQTSPRTRFDPHQPVSDGWHQQPGGMGGDFPPPPPPPYPGPGRVTPGGHLRAPYLPEHRPPGMPGMAPQGQGKSLFQPVQDRLSSRAFFATL